MPIETGPDRAELLYLAIGDQARGLSFGQRLALFDAMKTGKPFAQLAEHLQAAFRRALERLDRGR
jgi:hypothetical protein